MFHTYHVIGLILSGDKIEGVILQVFAWIAVFVLPLNAAVNPVLYTLSTASFLGLARSRASKFRRSLMNPISGGDTKTFVFGKLVKQKTSPSIELHVQT